METESPKGSAFMRIFGNELGYMNIDETTVQQAKDKFNILDLLLKLAQGQKIDLTKSVMFLDSTMTIPTIIGVPLKLSINGTTSVSIQGAGKLDMRHAPRSFSIDGYIQPR